MNFIQVIGLLIICFLGSWGISNWHSPTKFHELFYDLSELICGMVIVFFLLVMIYGVLKFLFSAWH